MCKAIITFCFLLQVYNLNGQDNGSGKAPGKQLYHPGTDARKELSEALAKAKTQNKHVFIIAGGNWCSWCHEFDRFCNAEYQVDSLLKSDYVVCYLNYSRENYNESIFSSFGYPQRFGFPVFIILDEKGNRLHTQNSEYLEQGKSYNKRRVVEFMQAWNRKAVDPMVYKNK